MKNCDSHLLQNIKLDILKTICEDQDGESIKLIRKHDTNLKHTGEFSIPSLGNTKAWRKFKMKEVDSNKLSEALSLIESCKEIGDILAIHLDHKKVIHQYFTNLGDLQEIGSNIDHGNVINFDSSKSNTSLLTSARFRRVEATFRSGILSPRSQKMHTLSSDIAGCWAKKFSFHCGLTKIVNSLK